MLFVFECKDGFCFWRKRSGSIRFWCIHFTPLSDITRLWPLAFLEIRDFDYGSYTTEWGARFFCNNSNFQRFSPLQRISREKRENSNCCKKFAPPTHSDTIFSLVMFKLLYIIHIYMDFFKFFVSILKLEQIQYKNYTIWLKNKWDSNLPHFSKHWKGGWKSVAISNLICSSTK